MNYTRGESGDGQIRSLSWMIIQNTIQLSDGQNMSKDAYQYWLTPPELYKKLDDEFHFDFDPCPYPRPDGYNSLVLPWGKMNYVNPPFRRADGPFGSITAFVRKAVSERSKGNRSVLILPVREYIWLLVQAGAQIRLAGRVQWLDTKTETFSKHPDNCGIFVL